MVKKTQTVVESLPQDVYPVVDVKTGEVFHVGTDLEESEKKAEQKRDQRFRFARALWAKPDLDELSSTALVKVYNTCAGANVKKFESRVVGLARLWKLIRPTHHNAITTSNGIDVSQQREDSDMATGNNAKKSAAKKTATKKSATKKTTPEKQAVTKKASTKKATKQSSSRGAVEIATSKGHHAEDKAAKHRRAEDKVASKRGGIGNLIRTMLGAGKPTEEIVAKVHADFPGCNTSAKTVAWYRSQMNRAGN